MTGNGAASTPPAEHGGRSSVLLILASAQFLMTLDSSVMNVSIQSVATDLGTTVTGIQTAITLYTLVMAAFMITGGKIGALIGRTSGLRDRPRRLRLRLVRHLHRAELTVLILGWSLLEGLGAALILPAIVSLVAGNVPQKGRPAAYGLIAAAGAIAVAAGPLIGGAVTTFASWRWVFVGEVVIVVVILAAPAQGPRHAARGAPAFDGLAPSCRCSDSPSPSTACSAPAPGAGSARRPTPAIAGVVARLLARGAPASSSSGA